MDPFYFVSWFVLGTIFGSFLNVLILRYHSGKGVRGRSRCASCGKGLSWHELVPIISFFALRGNCTSCGSKISYQYPIVEMISGVIFVFSFSLSLPILSTIVLISIFWLFLFISAYDLLHTIVPNEGVYLTAILSLIFSVGLGNAYFLDQIISGIALALPFYILWVVSKGMWMGLGDAKVALSIGFLLGLSDGASAILIAFWIGAVVALIILFLDWQKRALLMRSSKLKLSKRARTIKREVPFAPFLALGAFIVFFFNVNVFNFLLF